MSEGVNLLPGFPAFESPLLDHPAHGPQIRPENRSVARDLREKGYAIIDFPDETFDARAAAIRSALDDTFDWAGWREGGFDRSEGLRVLDAWQTNADVRAIATNPAMIALLSDVYGRQATPFQTLNFPVGSQQGVHSDASHFSSVPEKFMCGVWVALEDITHDAGPLFYYPGTQKWPNFGNEHFGVTAFGGTSIHAHAPVWNAMIETHGLQPERFIARKGQALIWVSTILHGGERQTNRNKTRWSQVTHYFFEGCAYYTPFYSDPFLGSIQFRTPVDIRTGEALKNVVGGRLVDPDFMKAAGARARRLRRGLSGEPDNTVLAALSRVFHAPLQYTRRVLSARR